METHEGMFEQSLGGIRFSQTPIWGENSAVVPNFYSHGTNVYFEREKEVMFVAKTICISIYLCI